MIKIIKDFPEYVNGIIIQNDSSTDVLLVHLKKRYKKYGIWQTLNQILLQLFLMFKKSSTINCFAELKRFKIDTIQVKDINSDTVIDFLKSKDCDFLINIGGGIMKEGTFSVPKVATVNIHPGINPIYRGAGGNFWAVYNNDFSNIGVTVHKIDSGIDTGEILFQEKFLVKKDDDMDSIVNKAFELGSDGIGKILVDYLTNGKLVTSIDSKLPPKYFGWYGLTHYFGVLSNLNHYKRSLSNVQ